MQEPEQTRVLDRCAAILCHEQKVTVEASRCGQKFTHVISQFLRQKKILGLVADPQVWDIRLYAREYGLANIGKDQSLKQPPNPAGNVLSKAIEERDLAMVLKTRKIRRGIPRKRKAKSIGGKKRFNAHCRRITRWVED